jgi:hypothetical protein
MPRALHLGLRRAARRGRKVADVHLTLTKLQKLPEIAAEDRACHPEGSHLPDRRQPQNPQERHGQGVAAEASQDRARVLIPKVAAWLNLIEGWWRMFRRQVLAGVDFADSYEIGQAAKVATRQLNRKAKPWVWGRPPRSPRHRRRTFVYRI